MKLFLTISISLFIGTIIAQNEIRVHNDEISSQFYKELDQKLVEYSQPNIEDSKKKTIRIWSGNEIILISDSSYYFKQLTNLKTDQTYTYRQAINVQTDILTIIKLDTLSIQYFIGHLPTAIEISENGQYYIKVVGGNKSIRRLKNKIYEEQVSTKIYNYLKVLPSGRYRSGKTSFMINHPIPNGFKQSNFYKKILSEFAKNKIRIDDPTNQPAIILDGAEICFEELNEVDEKNVLKYEVLNPEKGRIFGSRNRGVIIKTK